MTAPSPAVPGESEPTVEDLRREAYDNGRWCGECRYATVEEPACCYAPGDLAVLMREVSP